MYNTLAPEGHFAGIVLTRYGGFCCHNWDVRNNILAQNAAYAVWLYGPQAGPMQGLQGLNFSNNLYYHSAQAATHFSYSGDEDYSLAEFQSQTGQEAGSIFAEPMFVDAAGHDFHLQSTSTAINAGVALFHLSDDFDGNTRPQGAGYDIGAYEYAAVGPTVTPEPSPTTATTTPTNTPTPVPPTATPTNTSTNTPTPVPPTATPTPTYTLTNTPTPVPPTATLTPTYTPTNTPMPTSTPIPTATNTLTATPTPVPPTATPTQPQSGLITDIVVSNGKTYEKDTLATGKLVYIDRSYTFMSVPASYGGQEFIRMANNDKYATTPDFLTFTLTGDATVYIAYDVRATSLPVWLDGSWTDTGDTIGTSDVTRRLYKKGFAAGTVTLGGNAMAPMAGAGSNYNVIAIAAGSSATYTPTPVPPTATPTPTDTPTATPRNQPPVADAGPDQTVTDAALGETCP